MPSLSASQDLVNHQPERGNRLDALDHEEGGKRTLRQGRGVVSTPDRDVEGLTGSLVFGMAFVLSCTVFF